MQFYFNNLIILTILFGLYYSSTLRLETAGVEFENCFAPYAKIKASLKL